MKKFFTTVAAIAAMVLCIIACSTTVFAAENTVEAETISVETVETTETTETTENAETEEATTNVAESETTANAEPVDVNTTTAPSVKRTLKVTAKNYTGDAGNIKVFPVNGDIQTAYYTVDGKIAFCLNLR
jgi:ABC-type glycerol-3-phosphate transport system substrate-binding protein